MSSKELDWKEEIPKITAWKPLPQTHCNGTVVEENGYERQCKRKKPYRNERHDWKCHDHKEDS